MPSAVRALDRGTFLGERQLREVGGEFRERRLALGVSQAVVAAAARVARSRYAWVEAGKIRTLSIIEFNRIASVLGLDTSVQLYPGGPAIRDAASAGRLAKLTAKVGAPLNYRLEVPLPSTRDRFERRAWDGVLFGRGERTAIELEMRVRDVQALERRMSLKRRDDPTEHFLLLIADTRSNRRVLAEFAPLFADLPRLRPTDVWKALEAGQHPPTGFVLI